MPELHHSDQGTKYTNEDYHVVLGNKANEPTKHLVDSSVYTCGDDGCRQRIGYMHWVSNKSCKQLHRRRLMPRLLELNSH